MKTCPKCLSEHSKSGIYCSRSCANSRTFGIDSRAKKAASQKKSLALKSPEQRRAMVAPANAERSRRMREAVFHGPIDALGRGALRKRILAEQDGKCLICNISDWNGLPITFELDHIDGNNTNDERSNLRMLCPNCHSQTPTWRGRKNGCIAQW